MVHKKYTLSKDYAHGTEKQGKVNWKIFYSTTDARSFHNDKWIKGCNMLKSTQPSYNNHKSG